MEAFIEEKQKRHNEQQSNVTKKPKLDCMNDHTVKVSHSATESAKVKALELSSLVKSVKSKSSLLKQKRK